MKAKITYKLNKYYFNVEGNEGKIHVYYKDKEVMCTMQNDFYLSFDDVKRRVFRIVDDNSSIIKATRHVETNHYYNFRDLGGYNTKYDRKVKYGLLYRSSFFYKIEADQLHILKAISPKTIIDLRSSHEVKTKPNYKLDNCKYVNVKQTEKFEKPIRWFLIHLVRLVFSKEYPINYMKWNYRAIAKSYLQTKKVFEEILAAKTPIIFHCSSGKDRTGIISYLLLHILGVNDKDAFYDYMLSNKYRSRYDAMKIDNVYDYAILSKKRKEYMRKFYTVEEEYFNMFNEYVNKKYGSLELYITNQLGLSEKKQEKLRLMFLEK